MAFISFVKIISPFFFSCCLGIQVAMGFDEIQWKGRIGVWAGGGVLLAFRG